MARGSADMETEALPSVRVRCTAVRPNALSIVSDAVSATPGGGDVVGESIASSSLQSSLQSPLSVATPPTAIPTVPTTATARVYFTEKQYANSPFLVRVAFDSVTFVHRGTQVVERCFVFPDRVLHAVLTNFAPFATNTARSTTAVDGYGSQTHSQRRGAPLSPPMHPHLCVLVRSDCLNVYTAAGEVFEVALPFQANGLFPMTGNTRGLLLQRSPPAQIPSTTSKSSMASTVVGNRRASTSNRGDGDRYNYTSSNSSPSRAARPRFFTLAHPLDEVKPVALSSAAEAVGVRRGQRMGDKFLSDSALDAVAFLGDPWELPILVVFHKIKQRFCVFQMQALVSSTRQTRSPPRVKVVDGPTWTKHRAKSDVEEQRVRIEPEWMATPLWKSARLDRAPSSRARGVFLSPILSQSPSYSMLESPILPPSPLTVFPGSGETLTESKTAFVASGEKDNQPVLCMMDKETGTLLLKSMTEQDTGFGGKRTHSTMKDSVSRDLQTVHCRDAVPIRVQNHGVIAEGKGLQSDGDQVDIVVLRKDGTLVLHRAQHTVCHLVLPGVGEDDYSEDNAASTRTRLSGAVQLRSIQRDLAYEIVFPDFYGSCSGKIWQCKHPLEITSSPLVQQAFDVLSCVLPSNLSCEMQARVVQQAQQKASEQEGDESMDGGYEWQAFRELVVALAVAQSATEEDQASVGMGSSGDTEQMPSSSSSFSILCQTEYHDMYQYEHAMLFATMELPPPQGSRWTSVSSSQSSSPQTFNSGGISALKEHIETIFAALHVLCEELKLSIVLLRPRLQLANLLVDVAQTLELEPFIAYYQKDNCIFNGPLGFGTSSGSQAQLKTREQGLLRFADYGDVPDIVQWLQDVMSPGGHEAPPYPSLVKDPALKYSFDSAESKSNDGPLRRTRALCHIYKLLFLPRRSWLVMSAAEEQRERAANAAQLMMYLTQDPVGSALSLDDLPLGLRLPIAQAIHQVKHNPPPFITEDVCTFVDREDLGVRAGTEAETHDGQANPLGSHRQQQRDATVNVGEPQTSSEESTHEASDGLDETITRSQRLFPADQRMKEVARLLRSSRPLCLKIEKTPDLSDMDYAQQQQTRLLLLCKRSMALSVARGMVTLGSFDVASTQTQAWQLRVPPLPLAGRKPPANAIVELDTSGYAKELTHWPQFHNGCATGLRLPAHDLSGVINRHWIKYHRPNVNDLSQRGSATSASSSRQSPATQSAEVAKRKLEADYASHAGLLLGIGLRGHLKCLSMADVYNYLSLSNELVTVAIMLGMASTAAHCRRRRKKRATTAKAASNSANSISDSQDLQEFQSQPHPVASSENTDAKTTLEADGFLSVSSEVSSPDEAPLVGMGLELALERSVSKMLCLHIPSLLPPPFAGFSVPASTQTAALLGLGILYQGTGYRLMTELLLAEIARSPSSAQFVGGNSNTGLSTASFDQLEGYSLAAGMALGLVVLGRGQTKTGDPGLADLKLEEKLHKYIVGGAQQYRDSSAAGSCLYRGRRWQAFGNGSVDGRASNSGTASNGSGEAFPGVGREAKSGQERSGLRGSGEHVNIGITACGSALALAFMYMQTDNKVVATQLAVPDTLILLDYVRPDILLVRTLAKNLVMWHDVSPTTQWIEQHEIPVQLQQAYKALQPARVNGHGNKSENEDSLPPHADISSICEAYANIVAGACLSIGLRFAGTASAEAHETLRKYVLHFRELREKASSTSMILRGSSNVVAAATERATVERCLAVCAQALALVDAGTGNVKTLKLLRSVTLRQRVDAAMTYGSHMALSMAIGLLFLGGGRATLSRSKEAIAALVISLYPMAPMNTADNKYHLQAFRHLYVLAVDTSRLLETVDVNTKTNCAVQVRLELHPLAVGFLDKEEPRWLQLQTPCLLPELATIKRLVISNSDFYPVEIIMPACQSGYDASRVLQDNMRTANALRVDLMRSKNVVLLKPRKRKVLGFLTDELQQLHDLDLMSRGGNSSTDADDQLLLLFRTYFAARNCMEDDEDEDGDEELEVTDWGSSWWAPQLNARALEQVREESTLLLPLRLNALHALFRLQQVPHLTCTTDVVSLRLYCDYYRLHMPISALAPLPGYDKREDDPNGLLSIGDDLEKHYSTEDFGVWLANQTEEALRALWQRSSLPITSLASARMQLLTPASPQASNEAKQTKLELDTFLVDTLVRYFAGPTWSSRVSVDRQQDKDWKAKFQRVLTVCSSSQQQLAVSSSPSPTPLAPFHLAKFLQQEELSDAEKAFWLKLVSFFLFTS